MSFEFPDETAGARGICTYYISVLAFIIPANEKFILHFAIIYLVQISEPTYVRRMYLQAIKEIAQPDTT